MSKTAKKLVQNTLRNDLGAYFKRIKKGDWETVQLFIISGMTPDTRDRFKNTAMIIAASTGQLEIFKWASQKRILRIQKYSSFSTAQKTFVY